MREIRECVVAVVGGAGFLGSHLVNHLINDRKCHVVVIDNLVSGRREFVHPKAAFEHADITGAETYLHRLFTHHKVEYVFNYAAEPYIPTSFLRPVYVFNVNAFGAMKVINAAQESGCKGILQISSAEIYGEGYPGHEGKLTESAPVIPHSTYGTAKAAVDSMVQVRWKEAQTPVIALRQFNCVGEYETHPYIIPEIIAQFAADNQRDGMWYTINLGNNSFRDFQYAGDAVRMATELLEVGDFGEVYNMGSEDGIKMYDLAQKIGSLMGYRSVHVQPDKSRMRPWEIWHLQSDNTKLYSIIKTRPQVTFEEALKRTIKNYQDNGNHWCWEMSDAAV